MRIFRSPILKGFPETATTVSNQAIKRIIATPLYKNSLFLLADTAVSSVFGFIFWVVAARFYSEANVGSASAIISSVNLLAAISIVGLNLSIIRFLPASDKPERLINSSLTAIGIIAFIAGGIFIAGLSIWSPALIFIRQDIGLLASFLLIVLFMTVLDFIDSIFIARRSASLVVFTSFIMSILRIGLVIALAFAVSSSGIIFSWGLALLLTVVVSFWLLLPRVQAGYTLVPALEIRLLKDLSQYSAGSYAASLLAQAPSMILPLLVLNILGAQSNAYFYIAWTIAGFISAIPMAVSKSLFAEGANSVQNIKNNVIKSLKFTFLLSIPAVITMVLAAKWILLAFGPGYSTNALTLLWFLSLANLIRGIYPIYVSLLRIQDRIKELVIIQGISSIPTITLSYWATKMFGIVGVGYACLLVQIVIAIVVGTRLTLQLRRLPI